MIAAVCQHTRRRTNGKTIAGTIRYRCLDCGKSFTASTEQFDGMRLGEERAASIVQHLCEGSSVRSTSRITGTKRGCILDLLVLVGGRCKRFLAERIYAQPVKEVQLDEIWGWVGMKRKAAEKKGLTDADPVGDFYCFTAIERGTKLLLAWHLGRRDDVSTDIFVEKLQDACGGHFHLSTDGFPCYPPSIMRTFASTIEYGTVIKIYGNLNEFQVRRFASPRIVATTKAAIIGANSDMRACTSHVERHNGTIRCFTKRMSRLTYCFSKKVENHEAALALFFAFYNFCKPHRTLNVKNGPRRSPAMAAGVTDHVWSVAELLEKTASS